MGRREDNKRRTRQALIDAGLELFGARGFDETRVQDIVDQVGVSPATFFNYFPTKDAILEARAEETTDLYSALLRHEVERTDAGAAERLVQITRVLAAALGADPPIARLMATRTGLFSGASGAKADKDRAAQQLLADLVAQGQATGEFGSDADALQVAELYTAAITLTSTNWLMGWWGETEQPLEDRLVDALEVLLSGVRR